MGVPFFLILSVLSQETQNGHFSYACNMILVLPSFISLPCNRENPLTESCHRGPPERVSHLTGLTLNLQKLIYLEGYYGDRQTLPYSSTKDHLTLLSLMFLEKP